MICVFAYDEEQTEKISSMNTNIDRNKPQLIPPNKHALECVFVTVSATYLRTDVKALRT